MTLVSGSPEEVYAVAFDRFAALLTGSPAENAFKIQLLHYIPDLIFASRNRDVVGWTLTGALVSLLAHYVGGPQAGELRRMHDQGAEAWGPVLTHLRLCP